MTKNNMKYKQQQLVDKWIKKLTELGYSPKEMIEVFRLAKKKFLLYKETQNANKNICFS
jgi:Holliday junction resolvasome RuvABC DNA-binding subunit